MFSSGFGYSKLIMIFIACFIVYKLSGEEISRQEAFDLLSTLGTIAKVYPLDSRNQKMEKFPPAVVVHYKRYDSLRSVVKVYDTPASSSLLPLPLLPLLLHYHNPEKTKLINHCSRLLKDILFFASMHTISKLELANRIKEAISKTMLSTRKIAGRHTLATYP